MNVSKMKRFWKEEITKFQHRCKMLDRTDDLETREHIRAVTPNAISQMLHAFEHNEFKSLTEDLVLALETLHTELEGQGFFEKEEDGGECEPCEGN